LRAAPSWPPVSRCASCHSCCTGGPLPAMLAPLSQMLLSCPMLGVADRTDVPCTSVASVLLLPPMLGVADRD
jgi:hypothetical protein